MNKEKTTTKKTPTKAVKTPEKTVKKSDTTEKVDVEKFAVVEVPGSQLKVYEGQKYEVPYIEGKKGDDIVLDKVLLFSEEKKVKIGKPYLSKATVKATIDSQKKDEKVEGLLFKAKSRYRKKYGHRALITRLLIKEISV